MSFLMRASTVALALLIGSAAAVPMHRVPASPPTTAQSSSGRSR